MLNSDDPGALYFSKVPVPGIYSIMPNKKRYLVALKPIRKVDSEGIFSAHSEEYISKSYTPTSYVSYANAPKFLVRRLTSQQPREGFPALFESVTSSSSSSNTDVSTSSNSSNITNISTSSKASNNTLSSSVSSLISTRSIKFVDSKTSPQQEILHHTSSKHSKLDNNHHNTVSKTLISSTLSHNKGAKLQKCDINGYKPLHKPLRIELCRMLDRWMFKSEIEERQLNTMVCACDHKDPRKCKKGVWRDFLALDDAFSWVMVGKKEEKKGENERVLYCLDVVTDCMRKQDQVEVGRSSKVLSKAGNTGNCFFNDSADYVCLSF